MYLPTLFVCAFLSYNVSLAQEFKPFKVGVGIGYATPGSTGAGAGGGGLFYIEPGYRASDAVLIGLRLESAIIARGVEGVGDDDVSGDVASNVSYTLNGQYYFNDNYVRPFVGVGAGLFSLAAVEFNTSSNNSIDADKVNAETRFGFYPRIGIDAGHFNLTIDYNFLPKTDVPNIGKVRNNYLGIKAGFSIGGGIGQKRS